MAVEGRDGWTGSVGGCSSTMGRCGYRLGLGDRYSSGAVMDR